MRHTYRILLAVSAVFLIAATWTTGQVALTPTDIRAGSQAVADLDMTAYHTVLLQVDVKRRPGAGIVLISLYKSTDGVVYDDQPFVIEQPEGDTAWSYQLMGSTLPFVRVEIKHEGSGGYIRTAVRYAGLSR